MRNELTETEKVARELSGIENTSFIPMGSDSDLDKMIEDRKREKYNDKIEALDARIKEHTSKLQDYANEYASSLEGGMEIMPVNAGILVQPYNENPFQKVRIDKKSGIIIDAGGFTLERKNSDTGEDELPENYIRVGVVVEAGPTCKWVKKGDTIMWNKPTEMPIPFYSFGFCLVNEVHVLAVINDNLTARFKSE